MKKKISIVLAGILFLAGLSLLLYPLVANQWNNYRQSRLISEYESVVKDESRKGTINYEKEWERANAYNQSLLRSILPDSFAIAAASDKPGEEYMSCLNILTDEMMGYVEVPKINIKIPIFHTTSEEVLSKGAGHLEGSSLPVGGENTHSVVSAHRGLPSASLFTDLDQLEDGDHFLIRVLDQTLCYEVDQIHIVEPENTSDLAVEPGQDLVTLLTCTPYAVNDTILFSTKSSLGKRIVLLFPSPLSKYSVKYCLQVSTSVIEFFTKTAPPHGIYIISSFL